MYVAVKDAIEKCEAILERIIKKEARLRQPPISIIHCPEIYLKEIYIQYVAMLKRLKKRYSEWDYKILNAEKLLFNILKKLEYIDGYCDAKDCRREELAKDLKSSIKDELINTIQEHIQILLKEHNLDGPPSFLVIFNMHACYNYIQTKDLIATIHNLKKDILILILYLQRRSDSSSSAEAYKEANYNVNSYPFM